MESQSTIDNDKMPIIVNRRIIKHIENLYCWLAATCLEQQLALEFSKKLNTNPDTVRECPYSEPKNLP